MELEKVLNEYFYYFDEYFTKECKGNNSIKKRYQEIKAKMNKAIEVVKPSNFCQVLREVLDLDAQLQIMISLVETDLINDEKELLDMVEQDYIYYYKEVFNYRIDALPPNTLIHVLQK